MSDNVDLDAPEPEDGEDSILGIAKRRFRLALDSEADQRRRDREALRFQVPEMQWTDEARQERAGGIQNGVPVPARPCLAVSKLEQPIRMVENQERNAHLGVQIAPLTPDADDDTAEVLQDLYRSIERDSGAKEARSWAFARAVRTGLGWYRVLPCYDENAEEGPEAFDQVIKIERLLYQEAVHPDPAATKADFSDGDFLFCDEWVPLLRFRELYPDAEIPADDGMLVDDDEESDPIWVDDDGDQQAVRVCEYWYRKHDVETLTYGKGKDQKTRKRDKVTVWFAKITGAGIIEGPQQWNGRYIPFIPVLGRELQPIEGRRRWDGIIGPNMEAQRAYNFALSGAVEGVAIEPKAPYIGFAEQFEGYEAVWQQANTRNFPYLPVKKVVIDGQLAPMPQRNQVDGSRMQLAVGLAQTLEVALQSGTMQHDPSLGRPNGREQSGKAIQSLQQQGDVATSDFLANLADISLKYEAKVILDLIPSIYDRPGRVARILDEEDKTSAVILGQPFYKDAKTGQPVPLQEGQEPPAEMDPRTGQPVAPKRKHYDLAKGRYAVAVSVGRSRESKMEAGAEEIGQLLMAHPELFVALGDLYLRFRDYPGAREMADRMAKLREQQMPGIGADEEGGASPEQLQVENQKLKADLQGMQQGLQQLQQALETEQVKQQATLAKAEMDGQVKVAVAQIDAGVKREIAELKAQLDMVLATMDGKQQDKKQQHDAAHDVAMAATQGIAGTKDAQFKTFAGSVGQPLGADKGEV